MKLIVGLGNIGEQYEFTRHNIGFTALNEIIRKFETLDKTFWNEEKKLKTRTKEIFIGKKKILLAKPSTYMNSSGFAVSLISAYYKIITADIILIHDDADLPLGKIRVRFGGGAGGHKGVESVIDCLKTDKFLRIRLGVGRPSRIDGDKKVVTRKGIEEYVLSNFTSSDKSKVKQMTKQTVRIIEEIMEHGIDKYMSKFNK